MYCTQLHTYSLDYYYYGRCVCICSTCQIYDNSVIALSVHKITFDAWTVGLGRISLALALCVYSGIECQIRIRLSWLAFAACQTFILQNQSGKPYEYTKPDIKMPFVVVRSAEYLWIYSCGWCIYIDSNRYMNMTREYWHTPTTATHVIIPSPLCAYEYLPMYRIPRMRSCDISIIIMNFHQCQWNKSHLNTISTSAYTRRSPEVKWNKLIYCSDATGD